jgi:hypothetical protein
MALVTQNQNAGALQSTVAPFTGVNNASVRLLKAITAAELATLREGDTVYVESFRDYWKWLPLSTLTSDDTTVSAPTVVGAGPGRFERLTGNESPDWKLQQVWFVDSTVANQEGVGSALDPVQSDVEITRRWGSDGAIQLAPQVTITYAQAPTVTSNFDLRILDNAAVTWVGTPTVNKSGIVLTAVAIQVRTAGAEVPWAITGPTLGAADVGKLAIITASGTGANVGAYARVLKDNGGGSVRVSPFGTVVAGSVVFTQITPTIGDTINIVTPMVLRIGFFSLRNDTQLVPAAAPARNVFIFDSITLDGAVGAGVGLESGVVRSENSNVCYIRSILQNLTLTGTNTISNNHRLLGGGANSVDIKCNQALLRQVGITGTIAVFQASLLALQSDCYFQNAQLNVNQGAQVSSQGCAWFDKAVADTALTLGVAANGGFGFYRQTGAIPDWGTANTGHGLVVRSGSSYVYTTKPTINGTLGAGREALIGGTDKIYGAVPYVEGANLAALTLSA